MKKNLINKIYKKKVIDFPFDTQCCEINFYSWAHASSQMTLKQFNNKNKTNLTHLVSSTEWHIYDTCATDKLEKVTENDYWWVTMYAIRIRRETIYHVHNLLMPCCGNNTN
jgi:hypothetical protein